MSETTATNPTEPAPSEPYTGEAGVQGEQGCDPSDPLDAMLGPVRYAFSVQDGLFKRACPDSGFAFSLDLMEAVHEKLTAILNDPKNKTGYSYVYQFRDWLHETLKPPQPFRLGFVRQLINELQVADLAEKKRQETELRSMLNSLHSTVSTPQPGLI